MAMPDITSIELLDAKDLMKSVEIPQVLKYIEDEIEFWNQTDCNALNKSWLDFCFKNHKHVKVIDHDIPNQISGKDVKITLYDMKIQSKGPDDKVYNANEIFRQKVARGNSVIHVQDKHCQSHDGVIFALRKFTGGMGDEDEDQPESECTWQKYFLQPVENATEIIATEKANGEAAHLSARYINNQFYLIVGSKNVHLILTNFKDLDLYTESRFKVAKEVGLAVLEMLAKLSIENIQSLLSFLHFTKSTAVFEVLQPNYQHVVDLSYLGNSSQLKFITWTSAFKNESEDIQSFCALRPDKGLIFAQALGLPTVDFEVLPATQAEERMSIIRKGYASEGQVLYFINEHDHVIGLLKKKTAWYVLVRAIREKARAALSAMLKNPNSIESVKEGAKNKTTVRLQQIQKWIGFSDEYLMQWNSLANAFIQWLFDNKIQGIQGNFPQLWKEYLGSTCQSDQIVWK